VIRRLFALFALVLAACSAPAPAPPVSPTDTTTDIAEVHRARCAVCHVIVLPGSRPRAALEVALLRHRKRVHLLEADWALLLDYLAPKASP
jgi:mono/diheme cytochrome c family protein